MVQPTRRDPVAVMAARHRGQPSTADRKVASPVAWWSVLPQHRSDPGSDDARRFL